MDERQAGPVVAVRVLPNGPLVRLSDVCNPKTGAPERVIGVGSSPDADVVVCDPRVSSIHCLLLPREDLWLEDCGSKNGTRVARIQVGRDPLAVFAGQVIEIGRSRILLCNKELEDCPADIVATNLQDFAREAKRSYGVFARAGRAIGVAPNTLRRWVTKGRGTW